MGFQGLYLIKELPCKIVDMTKSERNTELHYIHKDIESKWRDRWSEDNLYEVKDDDPRTKWYELTMYPYPSGDLHVGHWYAMAPSDAHSRFRRMQGYNVLHPMGFDAFGLPAENAAIKRGIHPYDWTMSNIKNMRRQFRLMGASYDWEREIVTCNPDYYKWNQWFFLKMYEAGLAYRAYAPANWCSSCNTVLANEQVLAEGDCERCGTIVSRRELNQWFFRITKYADELLDQTQLDWPDKINVMQSNWIGRSSGVEVDFDISEYKLDDKTLSIFTTRVDTLYGVTFIVMAPEHHLVSQLTTKKHQGNVDLYIEQTRRQSEIQRLSTDKEKTGVFTGSYCTNHLTGDRIPIFVADYVLVTYGTGVVMGVPAHDQRDFEFAQKYDLPVKVVISPPTWSGQPLNEAYVEDGIQINSGQFDGLKNRDAMKEIANFLEANHLGSLSIKYRMRDWLISRQRYWGTPIPIVYCTRCEIVPVPEEDLPVLLPKDAEFKPTGESPLATNDEFVNTFCPKCGGEAIRETDTMDTFVDSSWYQFRFTSPNTHDRPFDPESLHLWAPVDQYTGGAEHAVMHLLYARFFTKVLRDLGFIDFDEPFLRLFNQGHIIAEKQKMSKSRGNVISPDLYVSKVGADVVRSYLMFLGPWDQGGEWSDSGINGMARWMNRVWDLANRDSNICDNFPFDESIVRDLQRLMHKTISRVTNDIERFKFNTALAALMEYTNGLNQTWDNGGIDSKTWNDAIKTMLLLLAPMSPYITEELWELTGQKYSIHNQTWPKSNSDLAADDVFTLVMQVNGRVRDKINVSVDISEDDAKKLSIQSSRIQTHIKDKKVIKIIYVSGRLVNIVTQ